MSSTLKKLSLLAFAGMANLALQGQTLTDVDVGTPSQPGSMTTTTDASGGKVYTVVGGGSDIWNNSDNFHYAYMKVTGDFDYVMKVESLVGNSGDGGWSKVELMARLEDPAQPGAGPQGGDQHISNMTTRKSSDTPAGGSAGVNFRGPQWRANRDGASSWTSPTPGYPPNMPDNWVRLERVGSVFYMYSSNDGKTWNMYNPYSPQGWDTAGSWPGGADSTSSSYFTQAWPNTVFLGIAVTAHSDPDTTTAVVSNFKAYTPVPVAITTQPAGTVSIAANSQLQLSVVATGDPLHYQWRKNGTPVPTNGLGATYTIPLAQISDSGTYTVRVYGGGKEVISAGSVVTVTADTTPPTLARVNATDTFTGVKVIFSEPVNATAESKANYSIDQGITVSAVTRVDAKTVTLTTSKLDVGKTYTLTVNGVQDTAANTIAGNSTKTFQSFVFMQGVVLHKFWDNVTPNNIAGLTGDPRFPNSPTMVTVEPTYEYPPNGGNEAGDNYGNQLITWFTPDKTGDYVFFTCSDDPSNLYLSTDDTPANKKLIAQETGWSGARQWVATGSGDVTAKRSDQFTGTEWPAGPTITLTAGKKYYMESLHTEGGGGDNVGATFIMAGAADPANGSAPAFKGALIGAYVDATAGPPVISTQPQSAVVNAGGTATFTVATSMGAQPMNYQWRLNGQNVVNETNTSLTINNAKVANVGNYDVVISNPDGSATSAPARLIVAGAQATLFVVSDPGSLNASDAGVKARLESQGWKVFPIAAAASTTGDANGMALIVISSTVSSGDVGNKFRTAAVPALFWENALEDNFLMTTDEADVTRGSVTAQQQINIVKATDPMAAGLAAGKLTITTGAVDFSWGKPAGTASIVATLADDPTRAVIYGYDQGATLIDGSTKAPARRAYFLMTDNAFASLNADGLKLFDAAVTWAANITASPVAPLLSIAGNAGKVTVTFEGTLQSANKVDGPYTDVAGASPMTVTPSDAMKFYRAKK